MVKNICMFLLGKILYSFGRKKKKFAEEMYVPYNPASSHFARKGSRYFLGKFKIKWYFRMFCKQFMVNI